MNSSQAWLSMIKTGPLSFAKARVLNYEWKNTCQSVIDESIGMPIMFTSEDQYDGVTKLVGVITEPSTQHPECTLPLYLIGVAGGFQYAARAHEVESPQSEKLIHLMNVVEGVFSSARLNGMFVGPADLLAHGSEDDLLCFAADVETCHL